MPIFQKLKQTPKMFHKKIPKRYILNKIYFLNEWENETLFPLRPSPNQ